MVALSVIVTCAELSVVREEADSGGLVEAARAGVGSVACLVNRGRMSVGIGLGGAGRGISSVVDDGLRVRD
jgi:hypothetical protein